MSDFQNEIRERLRAAKSDARLRAASRAFTEASVASRYSYNFGWMGRPIIQYPQDIVAMQELVWSTRPDLIVETGIAHVPENRRLFPKLTVEANLWIGAYPRIARKGARERLEHVYDLFPRMKERRHQLAGTMSGGEQQMCAIGRALMSKPRLIMLDEPSTGLDPQARRHLWDIISQVKRNGKTIVLTTHYMEEAEQMCDRVAIIDDGRILTVGKPRELIRE